MLTLNRHPRRENVLFEEQEQPGIEEEEVPAEGDDGGDEGGNGGEGDAEGDEA
jgi:hypothetical protein